MAPNIALLANNYESKLLSALQAAPNQMLKIGALPKAGRELSQYTDRLHFVLDRLVDRVMVLGTAGDKATALLLPEPSEELKRYRSMVAIQQQQVEVMQQQQQQGQLGEHQQHQQQQGPAGLRQVQQQAGQMQQVFGTGDGARGTSEQQPQQQVGAVGQHPQDQQQPLRQQGMQWRQEQQVGMCQAQQLHQEKPREQQQQQQMLRPPLPPQQQQQQHAEGRGWQRHPTKEGAGDLDRPRQDGPYKQQQHRAAFPSQQAGYPGHQHQQYQQGEVPHGGARGPREQQQQQQGGWGQGQQVYRSSTSAGGGGDVRRGAGSSRYSQQQQREVQQPQDQQQQYQRDEPRGSWQQPRFSAEPYDTRPEQGFRDGPAGHRGDRASGYNWDARENQGGRRSPPRRGHQDRRRGGDSYGQQYGVGESEKRQRR